MLKLPAISQQGRKNLVGLSILLGLAAYWVIYKTPVFQGSEFWNFFKGPTLLYLILALIGLYLSHLGFDPELKQTNQDIQNFEVYARIVQGTFFLILALMFFLMISAMVGGIIYYCASKSLSATIWAGGILAFSFWVAFQIDASRR